MGKEEVWTWAEYLMLFSTVLGSGLFAILFTEYPYWRARRKKKKNLNAKKGRKP